MSTEPKSLQKGNITSQCSMNSACFLTHRRCWSSAERKDSPASIVHHWPWGVLTGKFTENSRLGINDVRGKQPEWLRYFDQGQPKPEWLERLAGIRKILMAGGRTLAQGALGWIWARSPQTIPIPGFRTVKQVEESVAALRLGPLTEDEVRQIMELLRW